eukprot:scaffold107428_cov54-Cyclotella_meneghiniana.AAC.2
MLGMTSVWPVRCQLGRWRGAGLEWSGTMDGAMEDGAEVGRDEGMNGEGGTVGGMVHVALWAVFFLSGLWTDFERTLDGPARERTLSGLRADFERTLDGDTIEFLGQISGRVGSSR